MSRVKVITNNTHSHTRYVLILLIIPYRTETAQYCPLKRHKRRDYLLVRFWKKLEGSKFMGQLVSLGWCVNMGRGDVLIIFTTHFHTLYFVLYIQSHYC